MATKFFRCRHCGNLVEMVIDSSVPIKCCGENMQELVANTVEASTEKHLPVVTKIDDNTLKIEVGSVAHPMQPEHHIAFVYVETENGGTRINLHDKPEAFYHIGQDRPVAVYEYCNLHGLWKVEL